MRLVKHTFVALCMATTVMSGTADLLAASEINMDAMKQARVQAEESLKQTFSNFEFNSFEPSVIDGVYQIDTGARMIYYAPAAKVLLFGEMWDATGKNLTAAALSAAAQERMKGMDLSSALEFGPADAPLITEYSNPHCGYCQQLHTYLKEKQQDGAIKLRRRIIFSVGHSQAASEAAEHILCSDNPEKALAEVYERRLSAPMQRCDEGRKRVLEHIKIAKAAGIQGTPTLVINGEFVRGFDRTRLEDFLQQISQKGE